MEALLSGITTIVDNSTWGMGGPKAEELAEPTIEIYKKVGIRAVYGRMVADYVSPDMEKLTEKVRKKEPEILHIPLNQVSLESPSEARREVEKLMSKHHLTENGRIQIWPSPVKPGLNTDESLLACSDLAKKHRSMVTMHLDETKMDAVMDKKRYGVTNVEHLDSIGFLNNRLLAGHCVWVSDRDITLLKKKDVKVAHLAVCNMYLGSGIAPIVEMLHKAITVGIGTDDASCTDNVNMIQTMKSTALLQKVKTLDASSVTAEKVLEMATIDGARAIEMQNDIGSLEKGKKADIIILNPEHPNLKPMHNIPSAIVYQAYGNEIDTAIVDGKILMENRSIPSINSLYGDRLLDLAQEAAEKIVERAGMRKLRNRPWTISQRSTKP
jgi:cytosine/adenosine deaminase-related metal-dependent hydrolase